MTAQILSGRIDVVGLPPGIAAKVLRSLPQSVDFEYVYSIEGTPYINVYRSGTLYYFEDNSTGNVLAVDMKPIFDKMFEHLFDCS